MNVFAAYDQYRKTLISSCINSPKSIIEIGASPGRYIAYLSSKFQLIPTALDFISDKQVIKNALGSMGVNNFNIIQEDFLQYKITEKFDIVYSLGFIEHFEQLMKFLISMYVY